MTTAYVATADRLLLAEGITSEDTAAAVRLADKRVECVAVSSSAPDRVFAGTFDSGLWRSTDAGETFERIGGEIEPAAVTALGISNHDSDTVWAGTEPSRIYRSTDGGNTWDHLEGLTDLPSASRWSFPPRPDTHHVRWIEPAPADPDTWYIGIEAGAFVVTRDGGETWDDRPPGARRDNHTIATHPDAPERVYSAAGDGYAESQDAGHTWKQRHDGLEHRYCWGLAVDPGDPDTVVMSTASTARNAHRTGPSYLYRKGSTGAVEQEERGVGEDDGTTSGDEWTRLDSPELDTGEGARRPVLASGTEPGELYAACDGGLSRTGDAGDSWERCEIPAASVSGPPSVGENDDVTWEDLLEGGPVRGLAIV
ncbi:BNR repeat-containing protein with probable glycosyl-binding activity [Halalkaliarchaeum sp. AArc-CO]|uniref:WD40/YVTN/BNR-like repeat-containing protein n=1 Tax=unclassified Halalkaliarchaeum TaxID=2678344 RepID=UPI00217D173A|nr:MULTISPECIES: hypothetical protein [unclassified Halalkaliarchaeum]MDR5674117.1 hypothetical protein [Halalkaliarchaeum sp. AArc-GB]UWG50836.1 BNR repeat-containing protein with probable glycosyl-binding activity [Halalkaliarchaeum sp. AArc-CO]